VIEVDLDARHAPVASELMHARRREAQLYVARAPARTARRDVAPLAAIRAELPSMLT
jgi:hypothetical protein